MAKQTQKKTELDRKLDALPKKRKKFILAYVGKAKFNGRLAAEMAEYQGNDVTLASTAYEILRIPQIKEIVEELTAQDLQDRGFTKERVQRELTDVAFADLKDFVKLDDQGNVIIDIEQEGLPTAAISEISTTTIASKSDKDKTAWLTKIKLHDKKWATEMIAKHLKMDAGKDVKKIDGLEEILRAGREIVEEFSEGEK